MAVKKEPVAPAPVVSDKKKALETAMPVSYTHLTLPTKLEV